MLLMRLYCYDYWDTRFLLLVNNRMVNFTQRRRRRSSSSSSSITSTILKSFFIFITSSGKIITTIKAEWDGTCLGPRCEEKICSQALTCKNGGYCDGQSKCICPPDYGTMTCGEKVTFCTGGISCYNDALCPAQTGTGCRCDPHFTGFQCQNAVENIQDCQEGTNHYCLNSGVCDTDGLAACTCVGNYAGEYCEKAVTKCDEFHAVQYCENQGICKGTGCECIAGYHGVQCQNIGIDPLASSALSSSSAKYSKEELSIGFGIVVVLLVIAIIGTVCCVRQRSKRKNSQNIRRAAWNPNPGPGAYVYENGNQLDYRTNNNNNSARATTSNERKPARTQDIEMSSPETFHTPVGGGNEVAGRAYQPPDDQFGGDLPSAYTVSSPQTIPNPIAAALELANRDLGEQK